MSNNINNPGSVNPADQSFGTGLPSFTPADQAPGIGVSA
jgi:hypothetical protein